MPHLPASKHANFVKARCSFREQRGATIGKLILLISKAKRDCSNVVRPHIATHGSRRYFQTVFGIKPEANSENNEAKTQEVLSVPLGKEKLFMSLTEKNTQARSHNDPLLKVTTQGERCGFAQQVVTRVAKGEG